jgi:hypothetical protein
MNQTKKIAIDFIDDDQEEDFNYSINESQMEYGFKFLVGYKAKFFNRFSAEIYIPIITLYQKKKEEENNDYPNDRFGFQPHYSKQFDGINFKPFFHIGYSF